MNIDCQVPGLNPGLKLFAIGNYKSKNKNQLYLSKKKMVYQLNTVVKFGKHRGKTVEQILKTDPTYIRALFEKYRFV